MPGTEEMQDTEKGRSRVGACLYSACFHRLLHGIL